MAGREGTVYGTDYADLIGSTYVDAAGNSIGMFTDNDGTASPPDHIIVDAGASEDAIRMNFTEFPNVWRDYLTIVGGEGNDIIQLGDFVNVAAGTRILLDGGLGNDVIDLYWYENPDVTVEIYGGEGADKFAFASFSPGSRAVLADFEASQDSLEVMDRYERWVTISRDQITPDGNYRAHDSADGLVIEAYHGDAAYEPLVLVYTFILPGVTLDSFMNPGIGNGQIDGTAGRDVIRNDYVDSDGDRIAASGNIIMAGAGNDLINLTMSNSSVSCGDGRDFVTVRGLFNSVAGEGGDDYLIARWDTGLLDGGDGNDRLVGDIRRGGDHVMTGGNGADSFEFVFGATPTNAECIITDFELGVDRLMIDGVAIDLMNLPDGMLEGTDQSGSVTLSIGNDDRVTLNEVTLADLGLLAA